MSERPTTLTALGLKGVTGQLVQPFSGSTIERFIVFVFVFLIGE